MSYTKEQIVAQMKSSGIIPLLSHDNLEETCAILDAAYKGGIRVFEFTNRKKNSFEIFRELVPYIKKYPDFILGIGTVMDAATTEKFIDAGADFIISPVVKTEMAEVCNRRNVPWVPGCATLTEIVMGMDHGAAVIKVFPGSVLGPAFISAIRPVVPDVPLMITGGVEPTEKGLKIWFDAGATCVGLGSQLFPKDLLASKDWRALEWKFSSAVKVTEAILAKRN